jgi:hypothetical protein
MLDCAPIASLKAVGTTGRTSISELPAIHASGKQYAIAIDTDEFTINAAEASNQEPERRQADAASNALALPLTSPSLCAVSTQKFTASRKVVA